MPLNRDALPSTTRRLVHRVANQFLKQSKTPVTNAPGFDIVWGVVDSIDLTDTPHTLGVKLQGSATAYTGIKFFSSYMPTVGDSVVCYKYGRDLVVMGGMHGITASTSQTPHISVDMPSSVGMQVQSTVPLSFQSGVWNGIITTMAPPARYDTTHTDGSGGSGDPGFGLQQASYNAISSVGGPYVFGAELWYMDTTFAYIAQLTASVDVPVESYLQNGSIAGADWYDLGTMTAFAGDWTLTLDGGTGLLTPVGATDDLFFFKTMKVSFLNP